jgi:hypothetical protein
MNNYRYEIKFTLNEISYSDAIQWVYRYTNLENRYPDRYINSVYIDNLEYESIRANLAGLSDRVKNRLRWYDNIQTVRLENKIRNGRLSKKEAFQIDALKSSPTSLTTSQLKSKINNWLMTQSELGFDYYSATLGVRYLRKYFEDDNGFRVTFDREIQFTDLYDDEMSFSRSSRLVDYSPIIMEIKFDPSLKNYVNSILRLLNISPKRHSKYLVGMAHLENISYV